MSSTTQMMKNTTEVEYISIYDRPKRGKGRPRGSKYSDEEKVENQRQASMRCYYNNHEYYKLQKKIKSQINYHSKKNEV